MHGFQNFLTMLKNILVMNFGTPSVTSPGLSEYLNGVNPRELEQGIINTNKEIKVGKCFSQRVYKKFT